MECTESEKIAAEKRDIVKAKVDEINEKLSQLSNNKKEKMKHAKKTRKCVLCLLLRLLKITVEFNTLTIDVESPTNSFGMKKTDEIAKFSCKHKITKSCILDEKQTKKYPMIAYILQILICTAGFMPMQCM